MSKLENDANANQENNDNESIYENVISFVSSLKKPQLETVLALKKIQSDVHKIESNYRLELFELEKKFSELYSPLYKKRKDLLDGVEIPSESEIKEGRQILEQEEDEKLEITDSDDNTSSTKGLPRFWLKCLKNHYLLASRINTKDEECLEYLKDIKITYPNDPGFTLTFEFSENPYFTNKEITKSYYFENKCSESGDLILRDIESSKIDWKAEKNLCIEYKEKKQKHKKTRQVRIVKTEVKIDSFFRLFDNLDELEQEINENSDDESPEEIISQIMEQDYEIGEELKDRIIPHAVNWYTGKEHENDEYEVAYIILGRRRRLYRII